MISTDPRRAVEHGLTVIELMVALLLAAILSAGLFYMTAGQTRGYQTQLRSVTVQQNLWATMEYLQRQFFNAGYGFGTNCPSGNVNVWNNVNGSNTTVISSKGIEVYNSCALAHFSDGAPPTVAASCPSTVGDEVDAFIVSYAASTESGAYPVRINKSMPNSSSEIQADASGGLQVGDVAILFEPGSTKPCTAIQITHTQITGKGCKLQHHPQPPYNPPGGQNIFPPGGYGSGAVVTKFGSTTTPLKFAVDTASDPPRLVQWRDPSRNDMEVVASGIEDLQIAWACDFNAGAPADPTAVGSGPDGDLTEATGTVTPPTDRTKDEWANNVAGDAIPSCQYPKPPALSCTLNVDCKIAPIAAVRITLVGRTPGVEAGETGGRRPAAEDRAVGALDTTTNGGLGSYGRATLTAVVKTRNMGR